MSVSINNKNFHFVLVDTLLFHNCNKRNSHLVEA